MCASRRIKRARTQRGATLVEAALAVLLVGVVTTAALSAVRGTFQAQQRVAQRARALQLAEELAAEAALLPYCANGDACGTFGPDSGEVGTNRTTFDDFDDFHGLVDSPIRDAIGTVLADAVGWSRQVSCSWVAAANWDVTRVADENVKRLSITTQAPDGTQVKIVVYRTRYWRSVSTEVAE